MRAGYVRTALRHVHLYQSKNLAKDGLKLQSTQDLLQSLGFVKQTQSGLVHWLPLGLRTLNKIKAIIRNRMEANGKAQEVSLSLLSPKALWENTGRWNNGELFKLRDSKESDYCLAPTCEEEITSLMGSYISSYKDLPLTVYQIGRKYRDEKRPRGGLLRGREFLMKDAYSFDQTEQDAIKTFENMNNTYDLIFKDLRVPFVSAWADSGAIGGDLSKEYHFVHQSGEDTVLECDGCHQVSNVEKCHSYPQETNTYVGDVSVRYALNTARDTLICLYYPSNRTLNWNLVLAAMERDVDSSLADASNEKVLQLFHADKSEDDLMFSSVVRVMDCRLSSKSKFPDFPLTQYLKSNFSQLDDVSLVDAEEGEICGACEEGTLKGSKSIEVGHTFFLGQKYSKLLNAKFTTKDNTEQVCEMGCYGIGVSRLVAAIAQVTRDEMGLRWPRSVAPFQISLCAAKSDELLEEVASSLQTWNSDTWINQDAKANLGRKIATSHSLGIPVCVIVGKKQWPFVKLEVRAPYMTDKWRASQSQHRDAWGWECDDSAETGTVSEPVQKHTVHKDHLKDVVGVILTDM
ncbi:LAME_0C04478g1_1 [Lachancea meyersii CBS 8951]|uniref:proline--tRNA ligase n=1 Tax=Lachancea meyersii CBS 8951 TaxID=1266667 RepID=A0A1G4J0Z3_9SACH|nr:LAME_0C04478g1_1 [Lachancea meyersii CBS 8951]